LLEALKAQPSNRLLLFTAANADPGGQVVNAMIESFVSSRPNAHYVPSLGHLRYLSVLKHFDLVIGNSSSGLYEAPSFGCRTVNIGTRQSGRIKARSVFDCGNSRSEIVSTIETALYADLDRVQNPYGDGQSAPRIVTKVLEMQPPKKLLLKKFFDIEV